MITAFILIVVKPGEKDKVYEKLKNHPMVKEAYKVFGGYDVIVKLEVEDTSKLDDFRNKVLGKIKEVVMSEILIASSYGWKR